MGLSTSHGCYQGGYGGFKHLRLKLAKAAGYDTEMNTIFGEIPKLDWDAYPESAGLGEWDELPDDILIVLLVHSDCEGKLPHSLCKPLAERLKELSPLLDSDFYREQAEAFVVGLELADSLKQDVRFR